LHKKRANQLIATQVEESLDTTEQQGGNPPPAARRGQVQQKECMGNAIVKSGKLYEVQRRVNQRLRVARPMLEGRRLELMSNH